MKANVTVSRNNIPNSDRKAWFFLSQQFEKKKNIKAPDFVEFAEKVYRKFPHLPNKMVWGNYLIPEIIDQDFACFAIDYDNPNEILSFIKELAKEYGFICWANGEIYRPE